MLFLEDERENVVAFLHKQGVVDLRRSKLELGEVQSQTLPEISNALIKVNGALQLLKEGEVKSMPHMELRSLVSKISDAKYIDEIYQLGDKRREMQDDTANLTYGEKIATYFSEIDIDFSKLHSNALSFRGFITDAKSAEKIADAIKESKIKNSVIVKQVGKKKESVVFIAYQKDMALDDVFKDAKFDEIDLKSKYLVGTPGTVLANVKKTREAYAHELKEITKRLDELSNKHYSDLSNYKEMLEIEAQRANVSTNFKKTEKVFVVEGWVPQKKYEEFVKSLKSFTKGKVEIEKLNDKELAPTLVKRPKFLQPFDYLVEFLSVPRSDEIDPTWIFIVTFPIFYGLMISDVGYGIASFLLATWIARLRIKAAPEDILYNAAKIWQLNSIAVIVFGFLSNQYFGFHLNQYFTSFVGFDWVKDATSILLLTIVFGLVQVILGFVFSFINNWNKGHKKHAISKLTSMITILLGVVAVYGFFTSASYMIPFGIVMFIFLIVTAVLSGIEASEITNLMTHPLSYARILGFGLASIIIAMLIDTGFTPNFHNGILGFIILLIIFVLLHFVNMILGIFEGLIQGVRLNFVEFFSKFYTGGGIKYKPFAYKRVNTKEE